MCEDVRRQTTNISKELLFCLVSPPPYICIYVCWKRGLGNWFIYSFVWRHSDTDREYLLFAGWLADYLKRRVTQRQNLHLLVHSSDDHNNQSGPTQKLGLAGGWQGPRDLTLIICRLPRWTSRELSWKLSSQDSNQYSSVNTGIVSVSLTHNTGPVSIF